MAAEIRAVTVAFKWKSECSSAENEIRSVSALLCLFSFSCLVGQENFCEKTSVGVFDAGGSTHPESTSNELGNPETQAPFIQNACCEVFRVLCESDLSLVDLFSQALVGQNRSRVDHNNSIIPVKWEMWKAHPQQRQKQSAKICLQAKS